MNDEDRRRMTLTQAFGDYSELRDVVRARRNFAMKMLWPECRQTTLRLMLGSASEARVFGKAANRRLKEMADSVVTKRAGSVVLDLSRDVISGYDELWGCGFMGWRCLVVVVPARDEVLDPILGTCYGPEWMTNWKAPYTRSAIPFAFDQTATGTSAAFCLEGIENFDVVAAPEVAVRMLDYVATHCKLSRPDRW